MSRAWLKLYVKLLDDYDAMCLDDLTWRRMVEIFLVAADYDRDGLLPDMKQLGVRMRHDEESISNAIAELVGIGIIQEEAGTYRICNWDIYQPPTTSTERTRKYRQRQRGEADPLLPNGKVRLVRLRHSCAMILKRWLKKSRSSSMDQKQSKVRPMRANGSLKPSVKADVHRAVA